uniref:EGF repeat-containing protein n=1 Tax=Mesotes strigatus TaxID=3148976 RepID=H2FLD6_9SAUR|nr:EGF repeat-containing protein [Thamnodynastes strigatus]
MERSSAWGLLLGLWIAFSAFRGTRGDFCDVNLCQNGGTCLKITGEPGTTFFCLCEDGFIGPTCSEIEKGPCSLNPCKNKGKCEVIHSRGDDPDEYSCLCRRGYHGKNCDYSVCFSNPCKNEGECEVIPARGDANDEYRCICRPGYNGKNCENGDFCDVNLCENGGTCFKTPDDPTSFFCLCKYRYFGTTCHEYDKGPCLSDPCKNEGECEVIPGWGDLPDEYRCICRPGYNGKNCENGFTRARKQQKQRGIVNKTWKTSDFFAKS